jgi:peptide deformylase
MAVLEIRTFPDPVLKQKAKRVGTIDGSVKKLIADMLETVHAAPGRAGLAAPQVGVSLRVCVISAPEEEGGEEKDIVLVNPVLVRKSGERELEEGCLSLPGYYGEIVRAETVTVKGLDRKGKETRIKGEGLLAQALEHELDHLNGVLYIDRLESSEKLHKVEPDVTEI